MKIKGLHTYRFRKSFECLTTDKWMADLILKELKK